MKTLVRLGLVAIAMLAAAACSPHKIPPLTVSDLMEDRVTLDGILIKCNQNPASMQNSTDCVTARIAAERLDSQKQRNSDDEAKRLEAFERSRDQLRQQQDKQRQEQEAAKVKVDAYHLPVMPVEQPPPPKDPQSPIVGQTNP